MEQFISIKQFLTLRKLLHNGWILNEVSFRLNEVHFTNREDHYKILGDGTLVKFSNDPWKEVMVP